MDSLLITQLFCAFVPALIALAVAVVVSPRMFKLVANLFRFDMTALLLMMVACCVLFAVNRSMREIREQAWQEHLRMQKELQELGQFGYIDYGYTGGPYDYQIAALTFTSIFTVPCLIFARLLIDGYRDERRTRLERRERQSGEKLGESLSPKPEPTKPQWID